MKNKTVKKPLNTALMYLSGSIHASALCCMAFVLAYKLHIYFDFPLPSLEGLSVALVVCTFIFKKVLEMELKKSGTSIKDALPKQVTEILGGVLAFVLVLNMDLIINFMVDFINWFFYKFK